MLVYRLCIADCTGAGTDAAPDGDISPNPKVRIQIPMSPHLHGGGPKMSATDLLLLKSAGAVALREKVEAAEQSNFVANISKVSEAQIKEIQREFGDEGVFK